MGPWVPWSILIGWNRHHDYLTRSSAIGWEFESDFEMLCGTISFARDHFLRAGPFPSCGTISFARWRDDELILASIGFSSTFQLRPQFIYQTFAFTSCYSQPPSSIFIKHAIQPTDAIIQLHYCLATIEITIVTWCRWLSHPFQKPPQTLSSSSCLISNPSLNGPKSLLFQHRYLIILVILYFSKIPLFPMPLSTSLTPTTITVHGEENV